MTGQKIIQLLEKTANKSYKEAMEIIENDKDVAADSCTVLHHIIELRHHFNTLSDL